MKDVKITVDREDSSVSISITNDADDDTDAAARGQNGETGIDDWTDEEEDDDGIDAAYMAFVGSPHGKPAQKAPLSSQLACLLVPASEA